jgi:hypothetical protein
MLNRIKDIIYNLVGWLARLGPATTHSGKVLVVRVDEIGDYMEIATGDRYMSNWMLIHLIKQFG